MQYRELASTVPYLSYHNKNFISDRNSKLIENEITTRQSIKIEGLRNSYKLNKQANNELNFDTGRTLKQTRATQEFIQSKRYHQIELENNQSINNPINFQLNHQSNNPIKIMQREDKMMISQLNRIQPDRYSNLNQLNGKKIYQQFSEVMPQNKISLKQNLSQINSINGIHIQPKVIYSNSYQSQKTQQLHENTPNNYQEVYIERPSYKKIYHDKNQYFRNVGPQQDPIQFINQKKSFFYKLLPILGGIFLLLLVAATIYGAGKLGGIWDGTNEIFGTKYKTTLSNLSPVNNLFSNQQTATTNNFVSNQTQDGRQAQNSQQNKQTIGLSINKLSQANTTSSVGTNKITQPQQLINSTGKLTQSSVTISTKSITETISTLPPVDQLSNPSPSPQTIVEGSSSVINAEPVKNIEQTRLIIYDMLDNNPEYIPENFKTSLSNEILTEIEESVPQNFRYTKTIQEITHQHLQNFKQNQK